ncbi:uncharacterized protein LOC110845779 [Folsomia candida]|uniref:uncharacterized protein LOC110845779 n=1 Tax=Folsomia candida TaxID=158441 RepID=UPI00160534E9|nr:uncharacterized protein LOC110845779 [Folsomia candida]
MLLINFSRIVAIIIFYHSVPCLSDKNDKLTSKLNLILNLFIKNACSLHNLISEDDTLLFNNFLSKSTSNLIDRLNATHLGRYNFTWQLLNQDKLSRLNGLSSAKFSGSCHVMLFHLDQALRNYSVVNRLLDGLVVAKENPNYILFIAGSSSWVPLAFNLYLGLVYYTLDSKFMFVTKNFGLHLLCNHCFTVAQVLSKGNLRFDPEKITDLDEIHVKWYKVHKNLDWGILNLARVPLWRQLNGSCSFYKARLDTPAEDCTLLEMKLRFNFSIYGDGSGMDKGKKIVGGIFHGYISSAGFNRDKFLAVSVMKHIWIPYGCTYKPYVLVTLVGESSMNFLTLLQPLDRYCWIGLIISYLSITLMIFNVFKMGVMKLDNDSWHDRIYKGDIHALRSVGFWGISVFLEQSSHHLLKRFQWSWIAASCCSCWLLVSFILSNGYKGDLFSSMASQRLPAVPDSIPDLVTHYNLPVLTTTKHYLDGKYAHPTLKDIVLIDMAEGLIAAQQSLHMQLRDRLVFINGTDAALIANISRGIGVKSDLGHLLEITEDFALVSSEYDAKRFSILARRFTKFIPIQNPNQVSPYITRVPWYGYRNFFTTIFIPALGSLVESGIYERWVKYKELLTMILSLYEVDDKISRRNELSYKTQSNNSISNDRKVTSTSSRPNFYAMATLVPRGEHRKLGKSVLKGVSFQNVKIALILYFFCCSLGALAFLVEIPFNRWLVVKKDSPLMRKHFRNQRRTSILHCYY